MLSKLKPKQLFLRIFLPLVLIGVVLLSFTSWRQWSAVQEQRWQQVLDDAAASCTNTDGCSLETRAWLPYLREDGAPDSARLAELLAGGKPARLPWHSERFTVVSAPEGAEAAQLAVYQCWNPLSFVSDEGGTLAVKLLSFAALAALLALCLCAQAALVRRRREGQN